MLTPHLEGGGDGPDEGVPALPRRALLIAPTVERAATLGTAFHDAMAVTFEDYRAALVTDGDEVECVALTGVPTRGGRLAAVVAAVLEHCPPQVQLVLDVGAAGRELEGDGATALRGFRVIGRLLHESTPCLRLVRADDPASTPDLAIWLADGELRRAEPAASQVLDGLRAELDRARVELAAVAALAEAAQVDRAEAAHALTRLRGSAIGRLALRRAGAPGEVGEGSPLQRLRRSGGLAPLATLALAAGALASAGWAAVTYLEAALAAILVIGAAQVLMAWRVGYRGRSAVSRLATEVASTRAAQRELEGSVRDATSRLAAIERSLAVAAASTVDTAQSVVRLRERLRGERPTRSG